MYFKINIFNKYKIYKAVCEVSNNRALYTKSTSESLKFHKKPESAAIFLNKISKNVDHWWYSKDVQSTVSKFLKDNLLDEKNYISVLLDLLKKN